MWTEDEKEFIRIWKSIQKNEGENNMNKKNQQIGKGYISDLKKFEIFLRDFLSFLVGNYRDTEGFRKYFEDCDVDMEKYPEFNEFRQWFDSMWEEYLHELIDIAVYECLKKYENKLSENFTESFINRMYRGGYDYYESVDEQIREYLEEKMIEGCLYSLFPLLKELEKKYGKSQYKKHFTFSNK